MNTTENNKLIAEFMGAKRSLHRFSPDNGKILKYHTSWDWLMPVVEKINGFTDEHGIFLYEVNINASRCEIEMPTSVGNIVNEHRATTIEMVYEAVIQFIKWYNENTKS